MLKIKTDFGDLTVTKNAIGRIVSQAIDYYDGEIFLTNHKGKALKLKNNTGFIDNSPAMDMSAEEDGLYLHFCVLLRFGMSINAVTNQIFNTIESEMQAILGMPPARMEITVTGMYSKDVKNIAKRNIEVIR